MDGNMTQLRLLFSDNNNTKKYPADRRRKNKVSISFCLIVSFASCRKVGGNFDVTAAEPGPPFCLSITVAKWPFGLPRLRVEKHFLKRRYVRTRKICLLLRVCVSFGKLDTTAAE